MLKNLVVGAAVVLSVNTLAQERPSKKVRTLPREVITSTQDLLGSGDWKGHPEDSDLALGVLAGWANGTGTPSFNLLGTASVKVNRDGFIPDINDTASFEIQAGPLWDNNGLTFFNGSAHLRWDFKQNQTWGFYALGGLGFITGHGPFNLFPRVGVGAFYDMSKSFVIRAEFSRELLGFGVMVPLWF